MAEITNFFPIFIVPFLSKTPYFTSYMTTQDKKHISSSPLQPSQAIKGYIGLWDWKQKLNVLLLHTSLLIPLARLRVWDWAIFFSNDHGENKGKSSDTWSKIERKNYGPWTTSGKRTWVPALGTRFVSLGHQVKGK